MQSVESFYNINWIELNELLKKYITKGKKIVSFCYTKEDNATENGIIISYSYNGIIVLDE